MHLCLFSFFLYFYFYIFFILLTQNFPYLTILFTLSPQLSFPFLQKISPNFFSHLHLSIPTHSLHKTLSFSLSHAHTLHSYLTHTLGTVNHSQTHSLSRAQPSIRCNRFIVALKWRRFEALQ